MSKRLDTESVKQYCHERGFELVDDEYVSAKTAAHFKCECGNVFTSTFDNCKRGSRCKKCRYDKVGSALRHDYAYVKKFFEDAGCELLEDNYVSAAVKIKYRCKCGSIAYTNFSRFSLGKRCLACHKAAISGANNYRWRLDREQMSLDRLFGSR